MGNLITFWETVGEFRIVIPIIQRDYVQERARDNTHIDSALDKLLSDMYRAITSSNDEAKLSLNFVYGRKEGSGKDAELPPIDGQQRLTTLFLLHLYAFWKAGNVDGINILQDKFKYRTRETTEKFIDKLLAQVICIVNKDGEYRSILPIFSFMGKEPIDAFIEDQPWFMFEWRKDPTVRSMLFVLQRIHKIFRNVEELSCLLIDGSDRISFMILSSDEINIDDDLYVKLNARGKPLSEFENFKSDVIEELHDRGNYELAFEFSQAVDVMFVDLFWNGCDDSAVKRFDDRLMAFFHWNFFCDFLFSSGKRVLSNPKKAEDHAAKIKAEKLRGRNRHFRLSLYDYDCCEYTGMVRRMIKTLKLVYDNEVVRPLFDAVLSFWNQENITHAKVTHAKITHFYALSLFAEKFVPDNFASESLRLQDRHLNGWFRIMRNLLTNSLLDGLDEMQTVLGSINEVSESFDDLITHFSEKTEPFKKTSLGQYGDIVSEEQEKSRLILSNAEWKEAIMKAECPNEGLPYFNGQIISLLDFARGYAGYDLQAFNTHLLKFRLIFDKDGVKDSIVSEFRRALLSLGDYYIGYTFLVNGDRPRGQSWRDLLNRKEHNAKREHFYTLVNMLDVDRDISQQLDMIASSTSYDETDWRYWFTVEPGAMRFFETYAHFKKYPNYIALVPGLGANGNRNVEYYSYVLALKTGNEDSYIGERLYNEVWFEIADDRWVCSWYEEDDDGEKLSKYAICSEDEDIIEYLPLLAPGVLDVRSSIEVVNKYKNSG